MTTNKLFLLLGTSLSFLPQTLNAQCVSPIQDCYTLGYTQTSCPNGKGVKCPFGNGWYCGGTAAQDCIKLGYDKDCTGVGESGSGQTCNGKYQSCTCDSSYKYTCSGTGYSGGSGTACGGKYTKCNCKSPYTWTSGACKCPSTYKYTCSGTGYSGGSGSACGSKYTKCNCSNNYTWNGSNCALSCDSSYKYTCSGTGYAGGSGTACGGKYTTCTCSSGYEWKDSSCQPQLNGAIDNFYYCQGKIVGIKTNDMNFYIAMKDDGKSILDLALGQKPIFCGNIKGTLPSKNQLLTIYNNKTNLNNLLLSNSGSTLTNDWYWSSTYSNNNEGGGNPYYIVNLGNGNSQYTSYFSKEYYTRYILTSW